MISKRLGIHLAADGDVSAAWTSDEVSWQTQVCDDDALAQRAFGTALAPTSPLRFDCPAIGLPQRQDFPPR